MGFNPLRIDGAERLRGARRRDPIPRGSPRGGELAVNCGSYGLWELRIVEIVNGELWELRITEIEEVRAYGER